MKKKWFLFFLLIFFSLKTIDAKNITLGSREEWLDTVKEWTDIMVEDGDWYYYNSDNKTYWKDARNYKTHTSNCALMVVHCLQRFGAFDKNNKIWAGDDHQLVYRPSEEVTKKRLEAVANIYEFNGENPADVDLQPGDIVYYDGHINIYIGVKNGKRYYYDAGRGTTKTHQELGVWASFLSTAETHKVYGIIRLKYGQTVDAEGNTVDDGKNGSTEDPMGSAPIIETGELTCDTLFLNSDGSEKEFKKILDTIFNLIQIIAPVIAIVLTIIDYIKVIASNENSKKANIRTIKRIAIAVLIVFLPMLLDLLFHIFGLYDLSSCNIG